jgi:glycosyltransferase involved in cell wall biosynthesis
LERFNPTLRRSEAFRAKVGVGPRDVCLIWVGRLVPEKRPDIWRDVYLALLAEGLPVKGLVVGVGPCQAMFDACPGVAVAGWLSGVDLAEAYASADLLLFPSDVETFGNVTLEALGSGIPAVVENLCSQHLVTDGIEGFTVPHPLCIAPWTHILKHLERKSCASLLFPLLLLLLLLLLLCWSIVTSYVWSLL